MELTPLGDPKIDGILQAGFMLTLVLTYWCGAAEYWPFGKICNTIKVYLDFVHRFAMVTRK